MAIAVDLAEELRTEMVLDQITDPLMVKFLLEVFDVVHQMCDSLLLRRLLIFRVESHYDVILGRRRCHRCLFLLLVVPVDLEEVLANEPPEFSLQSLRQVLADVPHGRAAVIVGLFNSSIVVRVFEE